MKIAEWLATILTIVSVALITNGWTMHGFLLGLFAAAAWICWALIRGDARGIILTNALLGALHFNGFINLIGA